MELVDACLDTIKREFPDVTGVWLFGSTAIGESHASSDIDLAILSPRKIDSVRLWQCAQRIATLLYKDVDLVDLLDASTVMRAQVVQNGKLIFCSDRFTCDLFETHALTDYLRFSEERKALIADIKARGKVLGEHG
jgi:predicted nucleotidyltransferase